MISTTLTATVSRLHLLSLLLGIHSVHETTTSQTGNGIQLTFEPKELRVITAGDKHPVLCNVTGLAHENDTMRKAYVLSVHSADSSVANVNKANIPLQYTTTLSQMSVSQNNTYATLYANFTVIGEFIGKTQIDIVVFENDSKEGIIHAEYKVGVVRKPEPTTTIFYILLVIILALANVYMGIKTEFDIVKEVLKKPIQPAIGVCSQFLGMPCMAFGLAKLLLRKNYLGFGLLAIGSCPGGGASNIFTYLLDGDISLSVTMTFISTIVALGMTPFWIWVFGRYFMESLEVTGAPSLHILQSLALIIPPVCIGMLLQKFRPTWAGNFVKVMRVVFIILFLGFFPIAIYVNLYIWRLLTGRTILCGVLLSTSGYVLGTILGFIFRQKWKRVRTIAIEVGLQNVGVAMVIVRFALESPDSDLAVSTVVSCAIMQTLPLLIVTIVYQIYKKCQRKSGMTKLDDDSREHLSKDGPVN